MSAGIIQEIIDGKHDGDLNEIAFVVQQRNKRVRILKRQEQKFESPMVREFARLVKERPGLTANELAALMGVTAARVYQLGHAATPKYVKPIDPQEYPRRFWPQKDSGTRS